MVGVSVPFVITRYHVQNNAKLLTEEEILKARETASDSGKHSPATQISLLEFQGCRSWWADWEFAHPVQGYRNEFQMKGALFHSLPISSLIIHYFLYHNPIIFQ